MLTNYGHFRKLKYRIKNAIKAKDSLKLDSLRAIKSAILLAQTSKLMDCSVKLMLLNFASTCKTAKRVQKYIRTRRYDLAEPEVTGRNYKFLFTRTMSRPKYLLLLKKQLQKQMLQA